MATGGGRAGRPVRASGSSAAAARTSPSSRRPRPCCAELGDRPTSCGSCRPTARPTCSIATPRRPPGGARGDHRRRRRGRAPAGLLAAKTILPVIGVPIPTQHLGGLDSLLSIVQMPRGVPVATVAIGNAENAAILAAEILALHDDALRERVAAWRRRRPRPSSTTSRTPRRCPTDQANGSRASMPEKWRKSRSWVQT